MDCIYESATSLLFFYKGWEGYLASPPKITKDAFHEMIYRSNHLQDILNWLCLQPSFSVRFFLIALKGLCPFSFLETHVAAEVNETLSERCQMKDSSVLHSCAMLQV